MTVSPATGTDAPAAPPEVAAQVVVAFQLPVATEKRALAALAVEAPRKVPISVRSERAVNFFIRIAGVFWSSSLG